jgi:hypothetical protein
VIRELAMFVCRGLKLGYALSSSMVLCK